MIGFLVSKQHKNIFGKCFNDNNHKRSRGEANNTDFQGSDQMLRNTLSTVVHECSEIRQVARFINTAATERGVSSFAFDGFG